MAPHMVVERNECTGQELGAGMTLNDMLIVTHFLQSGPTCQKLHSLPPIGCPRFISVAVTSLLTTNSWSKKKGLLQLQAQVTVNHWGEVKAASQAGSHHIHSPEPRESIHPCCRLAFCYLSWLSVQFRARPREWCCTQETEPMCNEDCFPTEMPSVQSDLDHSSTETLLGWF